MMMRTLQNFYFIIVGLSSVRSTLYNRGIMDLIGKLDKNDDQSSSGLSDGFLNGLFGPFLDPNQKLENFLFNSSDFSYYSINIFDEDFPSCDERPTCSTIFSHILNQTVPFRIINMDINLALNQSNALNIVTQNSATISLLENLSSNNLTQNVWVFPIWSEHYQNALESKASAIEATQPLIDSLQVNSHVFVIIVSNNTWPWQRIKIIEVYRINKVLALQVNILNGSDATIWDRRKNLMGANMTIGFLDTFEVKPFKNTSELKEDETYISGHFQNGSIVHLKGYNIEYLKIFQAEMNFTPIFREEFRFGAYNQTSNTSFGLIELFQNRAIDFSINNINLNSDRAKVVDIAILNSAAGYKVRVILFEF